MIRLHSRLTSAARLRLFGALTIVATLSCSPGEGEEASAGSATAARTLTLGAYTTPREVYGREILPAFAREWKTKTGEDLRFEESYLGSGAQARAIVGGFEADVVALSLEPDIEQIARAKLITHDWRAMPNRGIVSRSIVVIAVRAGNPKRIADWDDLRRAGVEVVTPNPRTSGGAMWNIAAMYGAALRGGTSAPAGDSAAAARLLGDVLKNVIIMDKGARESLITFEKGIGDAAITYENEVIVARQSGQKVDYVVPRATIIIENPVAVVDAYADAHGNRALADAFVRFLATPDAQKAYGRYGLRPVGPSTTADSANTLPVVQSPFSIADLGGWPAVMASLFGSDGVFERVMAVTVRRR